MHMPVFIMGCEQQTEEIVLRLSEFGQCDS